jgi:signal peptidase
MKKILQYTGLAIMALLTMPSICAFAAYHSDGRADCVISGSMEPALKEGSLVFTFPVDVDDIEVGDIITFRCNSSSAVTITHRVTEIYKNSPVYFRTKGDACGTEDPVAVPARSVVGKVRFSLPFAGYVFSFLKTSTGFMTVIVIPSVILFVLFIQQFVLELKKQNRKNQGVSEK